MLLRKDYGWFHIELQFFDFQSNFIGPYLQKFSVFELSWSTLVIYQKRSQSSKRPNKHGQCYSGWIMHGFLQNCRFSIFRQISHVRTCKNFQFINYHGAHQLFIKKVPSQAKDLINVVSVTPDGLWMVSDRIVNSRFFVIFHRSVPAITFSFSTIMEHVSYPSKKLLIKPKTSSRW